MNLSYKTKEQAILDDGGWREDVFNIIMFWYRDSCEAPLFMKSLADIMYLEISGRRNWIEPN